MFNTHIDSFRSLRLGLVLIFTLLFDPVNAIESKELNLNSYRLDDRFTIGLPSANVNVASGKSFKDEANELYSGTLDAKQIKTLVDRTLIPAIEFPSNIAVSDIPDMTYVGDSICPQPVVSIGEDELELDEDYTVVCEENVNVGTAKLTVQGAGNYYGKVEKTFNITKAPLTVTAKNATIVYGEEPSNAGVEYSGFVGDDNENDLNDSIVFNYDYAPFDKVGIYVIIPGGLSSDNYKITFGEGELTVEPKEISIAWSDASFTYNGSEQIPMATANGVENSDECIFTVTGAATKVGKYTAKVTDLSNENYKLPATGLEQDFEITKAPLTVTALNDTIVYGDEPSNAGVEFSGFIDGENEKSLNGTLVYSNEYKQYGNVGEYAISPSGLTNDNYEIEFVAGKLTVEPKYVAVTWDKQNTFTYDGAEHAPTATLEGVLEGDKCGLTIAGAAVNAGKYTATAKELDNANYKLPANGLDQAFEITKADPTIIKNPAAIENLVYNGKEQTLVTAGEAKNCVMVYKLSEEDTYSESLPAATEAGEYTIHFMVRGNENYNDSKVQTLTATIEVPSSSSVEIASSSSVAESSSSEKVVSSSSESPKSSSSSKKVESSSSESPKSSSSSKKVESSSSESPKSSSSSKKVESSSSESPKSSSSSKKVESSSSEKTSLPEIARNAGALKVAFAHNELTVTNATASELKVFIFDMQGNLKKEYHGNSRGSHSISLNQMNRGTYLARVISGSDLQTLRVNVK